MRPTISMLRAFAAVALLACSGIQVNTDFDPAASSRLGAYKTYAWLPEPTGGDTRVHNAIVGGRVRRAVDAVLSGKGYSVAAGTPDFKVGWHANVEDKTDIETVNTYYGYGYGGGWGRYGGPGAVDSRTYVREYDQGTLILDVVDAQTNQLVWRGTASAELRPDTPPEDREKRIRDAVTKMLANFPPK